MKRAIFSAGMLLLAASAWAAPPVVPTATAVPAALPAPATTTAPAPSPLRVEAKFSNEHPTFGERIDLVVTLSYPSKLRVFFPSKPDVRPLLVDVRAPAQGRTTRQEQAGQVTETIRIPVLPVRTGIVRTPAIEVPWHEVTAGGGAGESGTVQVPPLKLQVKSQFAAETDAQPAPLPQARALVEENVWLEIALLVLAMMGLAAVLTLAGMRYYSARAAQLQPKVTVPPHLAAYRRLDALLASGRLHTDPPKQVIGELSEILREYLSGRYRFHALDMTTTELLEALERVDLRGVQLLEVRDFAEAGDLYKFAGLTPSADDLERMLGFVRQTIDRTLQSTSELAQIRDRELARLARQKRLRIEMMAPLAVRAQAFAIDLLVGALASALVAAAALRDHNQTLAVAAYAFLFVWLAVRDALGGGSPGKTITGLHIASFELETTQPHRWRPTRLGDSADALDDDDAPTAKMAEWPARLQRNLLMLLPFAGLIAEVATALLLPETRRLGDQWANTRVVDARHGARRKRPSWVPAVVMAGLALVVLLLPPLLVRPAPKDTATVSAPSEAAPAAPEAKP